MARLNTVNVVTNLEYGIRVHSFTDDDEGNNQADELFKRIVREEVENAEETITEDELEDAVCDGIWCRDMNTVVITHSA